MTSTVFVQYKGTDICLDFTCACGSQGHFDGYFAYALECGTCGQTWLLPDRFSPIRIEEGSAHSRKYHAKGVVVEMDS